MLMSICGALYYIANELTLYRWFKTFFYNVFQCPALEAQVRKPLFQPAVLILEVFHLFGIRGFHIADLRFPVVIAGFGNTGFAADTLDGASGFNGLQTAIIWCSVCAWRSPPGT